MIEKSHKIISIISVLFIFFVFYSYFKYNVGEQIYKFECPKDVAVIKFVEDEMTPKQVWEYNSNVSFTEYADKDFRKDCSVRADRSKFFKLLKFWAKLAATHDIPWWLTFGSLIGALRHKDIIPWDHDVDIVIPKDFEHLIRKISTQRQNISSTQVNIVTRPGDTCPYNGERSDCNGKSVSSHTDHCAFCGPFARIFFTGDQLIDIFLVDIVWYKGKLQVADEGKYEYKPSIPHFPVDWYFPLRNCSFMGLKVQCPRQSEKILIDHYKSYEAKSKCVNKIWNKVT